MKRSICILFFSVIAVPALAQIYKWKDENGVIQYSDTPPVSNTVKSQVIDIKDMPVSAISSKAPNGKASEASGAAAAKASAAAGGQPVYEKNEKQCSNLRGQKTYLEKGTRTRMVNEKGEAKRMDADMRKNEIAEIEKQMAKVCP